MAIEYGLVDDKEIPVADVIHAVIDQKVIPARKAEQDLAAFVDVDILIGILPLGIIRTEGLRSVRILDRLFTLVKKTMHFLLLSPVFDVTKAV
jgi:hypothetical protein